MNSKQVGTLTKGVDKMSIHDKNPKLEESYEEYTQKELEYIDHYKSVTGDAMDDEDIYDIIIKHNFDDSRIAKEVNEKMKIIKGRGEEYGWQTIISGKSKFIKLISRTKTRRKASRTQKTSKI